MKYRVTIKHGDHAADYDFNTLEDAGKFAWYARNFYTGKGQTIETDILEDSNEKHFYI